MFVIGFLVEVSAPVSEVEDGKDDGEHDAGHDVDALGARRELGDPRAPAAVPVRRRPSRSATDRHVELVRTHLIRWYTLTTNTPR